MRGMGVAMVCVVLLAGCFSSNSQGDDDEPLAAEDQGDGDSGDGDRGDGDSGDGDSGDGDRGDGDSGDGDSGDGDSGDGDSGDGDSGDGDDADHDNDDDRDGDDRDGDGGDGDVTAAPAGDGDVAPQDSAEDDPDGRDDDPGTGDNDGREDEGDAANPMWTPADKPPEDVENQGGMILNPARCETTHPFVLSIDPNGNSGSVSGWLESTPVLAFDNQLPRFQSSWNPGGGQASDLDIGVWWSIAGLGGPMDEPFVYFYPGVVESSHMRVAVAEGATGFDDIDYASLEFSDHVTPSVTPGTVVVVRNGADEVWLALRLDAVYPAAGENNDLCAAIDASWTFDL